MNVNWDAVSGIVDSLGAIGVFISLIYMALQIRQQADETRLMRNQSLITAVGDANTQLAADADLSEIILKGGEDFERLSPVERLRFSAYFYSILMHCDFAYHLYRSGGIDQQFWNQTERDVENFVTLPGGRMWWAQDKSRFSEAFQSYMDDRLDINTNA